MQTVQAFVGARGADSLPFSQGGSAAQAQSLKATGIDYFVGYLGAINAERLKHVLDAGMAFMPVTFADQFNGAATVAQCRTLGLPTGCTVWLDIEGQKAMDMGPVALIAAINTWADAVKAGGYEPGLYVGAPQPLTGDELYQLRVVRYWCAPSRVADRNGKIWDGPACGFCQRQLWPSKNWPDDKNPNRVFIDVDFISEDYLGRLPHWVTA